MVYIPSHQARQRGTCSWCREPYWGWMRVTHTSIGTVHHACARFALGKIKSLGGGGPAGDDFVYGRKATDPRIDDQFFGPELPDYDRQHQLWDEVEEFEDMTPPKPTHRYIHGEYLPTDTELREYVFDEVNGDPADRSRHFVNCMTTLADFYEKGWTASKSERKIQRVVKALSEAMTVGAPYEYQDWAYEYVETDPVGFADWVGRLLEEEWERA